MVKVHQRTGILPTIMPEASIVQTLPPSVPPSALKYLKIPDYNNKTKTRFCITESGFGLIVSVYYSAEYYGLVWSGLVWSGLVKVPISIYSCQ